MRKVSLFLLFPFFSILTQQDLYSDAIIKKIPVTTITRSAWLLEMQQKVAYQYYGNIDAKEEYQQLGREAQSIVGIPPEKQVRIKKLAPHAPNYNFAVACMCNGYIFVKEEFMDNAYFGIKRISLIHEAVHIKQFRPLEQRMTVINPSKYQKLEQEADFEAAYLGRCSHCTYEFSLKQPRQNDNHPQAKKFREMGYATFEQLGAISREQQKQRLVCPRHQRTELVEKIDEETIYRTFFPLTESK